MYAYAPNTVHLLPPNGVKSEALIYVDGSPGQIETVILLATTDPNAIKELRKIPLDRSVIRGKTVQFIAQQTENLQKARAKLAFKKRDCRKNQAMARSLACIPFKKTHKFLAIRLRFQIAPPR
jgi:hypothetical protein